MNHLLANLQHSGNLSAWDITPSAAFTIIRRYLLLALLSCVVAKAESAEAGNTDVKAKVDFYSAPREYSPMPGSTQTYMETSLLRGDKDLAERSARKLAAVLPLAIASLPVHAQQELRSLRFYLLWGSSAPQGGLRSGMRYVRRHEPTLHNGHDLRWEHAIIIYSAENFMYLDDLWSKKALVHELAHAWHVTHWPDNHEPIRNAWMNAVRSGLYKDVIDRKNRTIASAYAVKNPLEYFAELSAARFVGIEYHPFDKAELKRYDPMGYQMVEALWSVR